MDGSTAADAFGALAQETRLRAFRRIVRAGDAGVAAGALARALDVPHNTLSAHLAVLARAGLVRAEKRGRHMVYRVDAAGTRAMLGVLAAACCAGGPAACGDPGAAGSAEDAHKAEETAG